MLYCLLLLCNPALTLRCPCRAINLDGTHRLLHLSVSDEVRLQLNQRSIQRAMLTSAVVLLLTGWLFLGLFLCDQVDMLYGRKIQAVPDTARWIESFTVSWQHSKMHVRGAEAAAEPALAAAPAVDLHCQADVERHALQIAWFCTALATSIASSTACFSWGSWQVLTVLSHALSCQDA
jgi:hypothetical protein